MKLIERYIFWNALLGAGGAKDFDPAQITFTPNWQIGEAPEVQVGRQLFIAILNQ